MHPDPIILTHEQHVAEIMCMPISHRERLKQIDERSLDVLFDDQLRRVAEAIAEHEIPVMRLPSPLAWLLNGLLWAPIIVILFTVFRP